MDSSLKYFWEDICQIQKMVHKELCLFHDLLGDFKAPDFPSLDSIIRPVLVLLSSKLFDGPKQKTLSLASIFQLTHLAWLVHKQVKEDDEIKGDEIHRRQYPVLVGDYIYSRCYAELCNVGLSSFLLPMADIICSINEGGILSLQNPKAKEINSDAYKQIVYKETAIPLSGACRLGAALGKASKNEQNLLGEFGCAMGMFYGLFQDLNGDANKYSEHALYILSKLKEHPARKALESLINMVECSGNPKEMVV